MWRTWAFWGDFLLSLCKNIQGRAVKIFAVISPGVRVRVNCQFQVLNVVTNTVLQKTGVTCFGGKCWHCDTPTG